MAAAEIREATQITASPNKPSLKGQNQRVSASGVYPLQGGPPVPEALQEYRDVGGRVRVEGVAAHPRNHTRAPDCGV